MSGRQPAEVLADAPTPTHRLRRTSGWQLVDLHELFTYRDLLGILIWRDIKVRYRQTVVGVLWILLQPLISMIVFTFIFGRLGRLPTGGAWYPAMVLSGLVPWQFVSKALTEASTSLVVNERVITKVYFPRLLVPTATVTGGLIDLAISTTLLVVFGLVAGVPIGARILALPAFVLLALITCLGIAYWLSALDVEYRDVRYTLPFATQLALFVSPVVYSSTMIPEPWRIVYGLNPVAGIVEGFRWAVLGTPADPALLVASCLSAVALFVSGLIFFRGVERTMADTL